MIEGVHGYNMHPQMRCAVQIVVPCVPSDYFNRVQNRGIYLAWRILSRGCARARTSQQYPDPRQQFRLSEGLSQIVIRACIETANAILYPGPRRQDEDGECLTTPSDLLQEGKPVPIRQPQVEHHSGIRDRMKRRLSVSRRGHAVGLETGLDQGIAGQS